jgi:uncharacterized protein YbbC (DUF1343 family)/CubicO group peptidase (beta-lactamase class C family)
MTTPVRAGYTIPLVALVLVVTLHRAEAAPPEPSLALLDRAGQLIERAIEEEKLQGAVLLVGQGDRVVYRRAFGSRSVQPQRVAMTEDTIFDLASLSKPVGCATSVMLLAERGKLRLSDPVAKHIPAFAANGKEAITIEQLLLHRGGLIPDNPLSDYDHGPQKALQNVYNLRPQWPPGSRFAYTDVGYIVLGEVVKAAAGKGLDQFARQEIFAPAGMKDTSYLPSQSLRPRIAPTEKRGDHWMIGEVHDPRAYALGGFAGHAGLFGTADDLARYCRMILAGGRIDGRQVLSEATVREMTRPRPVPGDSDLRSYGFDVDTPYSSPRGERYPRRTSFGHTGFTGTSFWMDPESRSYVILLSSSVHPEGKGRVIDLRREVATAVAEALLGPAPAPVVLSGIDVLKRDDFKPLAGRKIALITNHTGRDRDGNRTVDLLAGAKNLKLVRLFSPEHGLYGVLDEKVGHGTDEKTGLKVFSLYGQTQRPTPEMLEGIDTMVFDIQDVGARFYTYLSTLGLCMEEAAKRKVRMVVLDRPNPNTGLVVDGPVAQKKHFSFICYGPIPVSHGMTVGELARLFNEEFNIHCDLQLVPMDGWKRTMWWDDTGWMWVNPSPNIRNPTQALLYPAIGLLETSNVSVGRGTDQPFELLGAPWIDGRRLAAALNAARIGGLRFVPITFTPRSGKFEGKPCSGVYIEVTDRRAFSLSPVSAGVTIAWHLESLFKDAYQVQDVGRMLHNDDALKALMTSTSPDQVPASWKDSLAEFRKTREKYLLYR